VSSTAEPTPNDRARRAREQGARAASWAQERVPGAWAVREALERERVAAAGLLAGGLAYRLFFWLVPLGLVFAAVLSFWVDESRASLEDAARDFGISGAATDAAMDAIQRETHARWYYLLAGAFLVFWFGIGVVRAMNVAHAVAWRLPPRKLRRPYFAGGVFSGVTISVVGVTAATAWLREDSENTGLLATLSLTAVYVAACLWIIDRLPHRETTWKGLLPGAVLVAVGAQVVHVVVVLYIVPRLGRSSELYGTLGAATVVLLWLYLVARLFVAGAFLNAAVWHRRNREGT
jgi:uncharacterized BrkB/YihY/UPF0761 family membrane protein